MKRLSLAVDLGGTHATCAVVDDRGVLARRTAACSGEEPLAAALPLLAAGLREAVREAGVAVADCAGVALGFCGLVDADGGRVLATNGKYEDAPQVDLAEWARSEFGLPLRMENDARMALLGERAAGAARGFDDVVMMTLGTGIGGAAMIGGRLLRGKHYQAGCLGGHFPMNPRGRACTCGGVGCAEAEASTWALPAICRSWPRFVGSALMDEAALDFETIFRVAGSGDAVAEEILEHCLGVWSALAVGLIHAYDPEVVVVGGGVMRSAGRVLPAIRKRVEETAWTPWGRVEVRAAGCGEDAALAGAVPLLCEHT